MALSENINSLEKSKFLEFLGETALRVVVVNQQNFIKNFGRIDLSIGDQSIIINLSTEMADLNYCGIVTIESSEAIPAFLNPIISEKTKNSMTVLLNAPISASGYVLNYVTIG